MRSASSACSLVHCSCSRIGYYVYCVTLPACRGTCDLLPIVQYTHCSLLWDMRGFGRASATGTAGSGGPQLLLFISITDIHMRMVRNSAVSYARHVINDGRLSCFHNRYKHNTCNLTVTRYLCSKFKYYFICFRSREQEVLGRLEVGRICQVEAIDFIRTSPEAGGHG